MTDQQLKQGQELKRIIATLESELEKFNNANPSGINVYLPNVGTLIERVKIDFIKQLELYKLKFKEL
jgi:hypothetical protein